MVNRWTRRFTYSSIWQQSPDINPAVPPLPPSVVKDPLHPPLHSKLVHLGGGAYLSRGPVSPRRRILLKGRNLPLDDEPFTLPSIGPRTPRRRREEANLAAEARPQCSCGVLCRCRLGGCAGTRTSEFCSVEKRRSRTSRL